MIPMSCVFAHINRITQCVNRISWKRVETMFYVCDILLTPGGGRVTCRQVLTGKSLPTLPALKKTSGRSSDEPEINGLGEGIFGKKEGADQI